MKRLDIVQHLVGVAFICLMVSGCAGFMRSTAPPLVPFEEGASALAVQLLNRIEQDRKSTGGGESANVMLIPFADEDSGQVPQISRRIEAIFLETGQTQYKNLRLARLTYQNIAQADYLVSGTIGLNEYPRKSGNFPEKQYRITGKARSRASTSLLGEGSIWIGEQNLNYTPTAIYKDSPLYLKGSYLRPPEKSPSEPAPQYLDITLETMAIQIEGRMAYEKGDYQAARRLFAMAAQRRDGQDLGTYAGLYLANYKLGRKTEADAAFRKVVEISVEKHRYLTVKYLFGVNSVDFLKDSALRERYAEWMRHIGEYFQGTTHCLHIVGHASRTGTDEYNRQLSLERAEEVRKRLSQTFPSIYGRSTIEGRGFSQNIVGTGTDDERDELDRRVELFIVKCSK